MAHDTLKQANKQKRDEFYTRLRDIEDELKHYKSQLKDKVIFCNCDDPFESNFFKYFAMNFKQLGLKKLITTCYDPSPIANKEVRLSSLNEEKETNYNNASRRKIISRAYKIELDDITDIDGSGNINILDTKEILLREKAKLDNGERSKILSYLDGDGDFRSDECVELLKQADIVITNPPFSLFREYVAQLVEYDKKFLILGNMNALTYKEIFKLIKENKIWSGYGFNMSMVYKSPYRNTLESNRKFVIGKGLDPDRYIKVPAINWFTNLETKKRHEEIVLYKKYSPEEYPEYGNYKAINVDKVAEIPYDYDKEMGVPITFIDRYSPEQFDIVALGIVGSVEFTENRKMEIMRNGKSTGKFTMNAKGTLYRKYNPEKDKSPAFKDCETGELYSSIYARILIKRKANQ